VILVGIPGAGKTTLRRERFPTHDCISKDAMPNVRDKQARQDAALRAAFGAGRSVVVDTRRPYNLLRSGRRFARAAASGKATIFAWRFGWATSHVRVHASHSYSCRSCTGRRARMRGDWQKGQDVRPDMVTLPGNRVCPSLFRPRAERKLNLW